MNSMYGKTFYDVNRDSTSAGARKMMNLIYTSLHPTSAIDFGCGSGTWLNELYQLSSCEIEICGIDGEWVENNGGVLFPEKYFRAEDLTRKITLEKKYDIAISLEVAEHLEEQYADTFIDNICRSSDVVLFSAAIPFMGGTHHVNEQWPSYWIEKFEARGYKVLDAIRPLIWEEDCIPACYRQDTLLYVKTDKYLEVIEKIPMGKQMYNIVHPAKYLEAKQVDKIINRAWLLNHLPETLFEKLKKIYLRFGGKSQVV